MKKRAHRHVRHHRHSPSRKAGSTENYLVVVRGWMLVVAFALMLGVGAVVGNFINGQLNETSPMVAGATIEK